MKTSFANLRVVSLLIMILTITFTNINAAWLDNLPYTITQNDGSSISTFVSGDEFHNWVHDARGYTIIRDEITNNWSWAIEQNGDLISSGYSVHLHDPVTRNIPPFANISNEMYLQRREKFDQSISVVNSKSLSTGTFNQIVIFIRFSDDEEFDPNQTAGISTMFNGLGNVNSKRQYFRDASYWDGNGQGLDLISHFFPPIDKGFITSYQSPHPRSYYLEGLPYTKYTRRIELLNAAMMSVDSYFGNVSESKKFDKDSNGCIDNVVFIIKGDYVSDNLTFWPHHDYLTLNQSLSNGFKQLSYNLIPEQMLLHIDYCKVGILAHEFGHTLGAPDLVDRAAPRIKPIRHWCLMANQTNPPQSFSAHVKEKYFGWMVIPWMPSSGHYTLYPLGTHKVGSAYRIKSKYADDEHFLVEYRKATGIDSKLPGSGLLVYRVRPTTRGNTYLPYELFLFRPDDPSSDTGNIDNAYFSAESRRTRINQHTDPNIFFSDGQIEWLEFSNIGSAGSTISFDVTIPNYTGSIKHDLTTTYHEIWDSNQIHQYQPIHYSWVSFPYLDKRLDTVEVDDIDYTRDDLIYNLNHTNDNKLWQYENLETTVMWKYNEIEGSLNQSDFTQNKKHQMHSQYGYKIQLMHYRPANTYVPIDLNGKKSLTVNGFRIGAPGNSFRNISMELKAKPNNAAYREVWVGYYLGTNETPLTALRNVSNQLIEIKTRHWSMNRASVNYSWNYSTANPRFNFGEAVSLRYVGTTDTSFNWMPHVNETIREPYVYPEPTHFKFVEEADYIPIFVTLSDDMISDQGGEIGLFINGVCYGAEVIQGEIAQINAYITETDIDLSTADVEFQIHNYNTRSANVRISDYLVLDQSSRTYQTGNLDMSQNQMFYKVSFNDEQVEEEVTHVTALFGNYPNPFNPTTTISFSIAKPDIVRLNIYNIKGQLVNTLVNRELSAGNHSVVWNGVDNNQNKVSSGIYFYRLETNSKIEVKKMLLMK